MLNSISEYSKLWVACVGAVTTIYSESPKRKMNVTNVLYIQLVQDKNIVGVYATSCDLKASSVVAFTVVSGS